MKKIIAVLSVTILILTSMVSFSAMADDDTTNNNQMDNQAFTVIEENDKYRLSVNVNDANFSVVDKRNNKTWYAFDPNLEDLSTVSKTEKKALQSMLNISYYNTDGNLVSIGSHSRSIEDGTFLIKKVKKGFEIIYTFNREGENFTVPVDITLTNSGMYASIPYDKVEENSEMQICDLELLPNFGSGYYTDNGYILIPDGSGAIAEFSNGKEHNTDYLEPVYSKDMSQDLILNDTANKQGIRMPVYGIKQNDNAYIAVIESSDYNASIHATTLSGYTSCGASFTFRESDLTGIQAKDTSTRIVTLTGKNHLKSSPIIHFNFLYGNNANYSGMANTYRNYLVKKYNLKKVKSKNEVSLNIESFGGVKEDYIFAGLTFNHIKKVTTIKDLISMQEDFSKEKQTAVKWSLYGFLNGGYEEKSNSKISIQSGLGSKSQLRDLADKAGNDNVYVGVNVIKMYNHSWQSFKNNSLIKGLNGLMVQKYYSLLSNGTRNTDVGYWNYYNINSVEKMSTSISKKLDGNYGIMYSGFGDELYSDFRSEKVTDKGDLVKEYQNTAKKTALTGSSVAVENGNVYMVGSANFISEVPLKSSSFDIESYSVPFYSMVLHGYVSMSSEPINNDSASNDVFLKSMETGTAVTYRVTSCDSYELKDTKLSFLYNTKYTSEYSKQISDSSKLIKAWQSKIANQCIVSNELKDGISTTIYENGNKIIVNYSDKEITCNNEKIPSKSYLIV